jgi:hypothetical protein
MNSYDDSFDHEKIFELSQTELSGLMKEFGKALIRRGEPVRLFGELPAERDGPEPYTFVTSIDLVVARELFHADDPDMLLTACEAHYAMPHRIGEGKDEPVFESVSVYLDSEMRNTGIVLHESYTIQREADGFSASVSTEYTLDGKGISPNNISYEGQRPAISDQRIIDIVDDNLATDREMTLDDLEKFRVLLDVLG